MNQPMVTYTNPVLPGFYPDPSVIRVGEDYYLAVSSFEYFPGLPIFHSRDLIHWQQIGHALHRTTQIDMSSRQSSQGIYAPTIRYHKGTFYLITTDVYGIGNFYITAENPAGPWSDPIRIPYGNIDPSLMFDEDDKVYVTTQMGADEHSHIIQYEIDIATGEALTEPVVVARGDGGVWTEGPHLYKIKGRYYLLCACGGTGSDHRSLVYRSDNPHGPFVMMPHPMLTHNQLKEHPIQNTGHAELIDDTEGNWWAMFLAVRPVDGQYSVLGRESFLAPVIWTEDGWPTIDNNEGTVQFEMNVPLKSEGTAGSSSGSTVYLSERQNWEYSGHSSWVEHFDAPFLSLRWTSMRTLLEDRISLSERPGALALTGNSNSLRDNAPVVFLGARQQHHSMSVETVIEFAPVQEGEEAGLAIRLNEQSHAQIGVQYRAGKRVVMAAAVDRGEYRLLAEHEIAASEHKLRITSDARSYRLMAELIPGEWSTLAEVPAISLSPERNGGFTGVLAGVYATGNGQDCVTTAYVDYFKYDI